MSLLYGGPAVSNVLYHLYNDNFNAANFTNRNYVFHILLLAQISKFVLQRPLVGWPLTIAVAAVGVGSFGMYWHHKLEPFWKRRALRRGVGGPTVADRPKRNSQPPIERIELPSLLPATRTSDAIPENRQLELPQPDVPHDSNQHPVSEYDRGFEAGKREGYIEGYNKGLEQGDWKGYHKGHSEGHAKGYREGHSDGFDHHFRRIQHSDDDPP